MVWRANRAAPATPIREAGAVIAGYDYVDAWDWAIVAQESTDTTLAPVEEQRSLALVLILVGTLLAHRVRGAVCVAGHASVAGVEWCGRRGGGRSVGCTGRAAWVGGDGGAGGVVQLDARDV